MAAVFWNMLVQVALGDDLMFAPFIAMSGEVIFQWQRDIKWGFGGCFTVLLSLPDSLGICVQACGVLLHRHYSLFMVVFGTKPECFGSRFSWWGRESIGWFKMSQHKDFACFEGKGFRNTMQQLGGIAGFHGNVKRVVHHFSTVALLVFPGTMARFVGVFVDVRVFIGANVQQQNKKRRGPGEDKHKCSEFVAVGWRHAMNVMSWRAP